VRAVDTSVLVYAEMTTSRHHVAARGLLEELAEDARPWAIPWPCVYEFLRVVTHPRVYHPPAPLQVALTDLRSILASPSMVLLSETSRHADIMASVLEASSVAGNLVHDAHIAALCLEHGVSEFLTGDRDFSRFPGLRVDHPF
jgi:toxin-antitoxin system PIN domain toxin